MLACSKTSCDIDFMRLIKMLSFSNICAMFGGAEYAKIGIRYVKVKLPGREEEVRLLRSKCPRIESMTSFNLADLAAKA